MITIRRVLTSSRIRNLLLIASLLIGGGCSGSSPDSLWSCVEWIPIDSGSEVHTARRLSRLGAKEMGFSNGIRGAPATALESGDFFLPQRRALDGRRISYQPLLLKERSPCDDPLRIIAFAMEWEILEGEFSGTVVPIDLGKAFGYGRPRVSYFGRKMAVWPEESFPIPVALIRRTPRQLGGWTGEQAPRALIDSASFWHAVEGLERTLGRDLFRPARLDDLPMVLRQLSDGTWVRDPPEGAVIVNLLRLPERVFDLGMPIASASTGRFCLIEDSKGECALEGIDRGQMHIFLRDEPGVEMLDHSTVQHELLHILGVGHSCFFPTLMSTAAHAEEAEGCAGRRDWKGTHSRWSSLTIFDVAYLELKAEAAKKMMLHGTPLGPSETLDGAIALRAVRR